MLARRVSPSLLAVGLAIWKKWKARVRVAGPLQIFQFVILNYCEEHLGDM